MHIECCFLCWLLLLLIVLFYFFLSKGSGDKKKKKEKDTLSTSLWTLCRTGLSFGLEMLKGGKADCVFIWASFPLKNYQITGGLISHRPALSVEDLQQSCV